MAHVLITFSNAFSRTKKNVFWFLRTKCRYFDGATLSSLPVPEFVGFFLQLALQPRTKITVYPKKYAHDFVVLCFVVVMQSFIMNSHEAFIHIHQGCFAGTGAIVRLPQCQWSKPDEYGKISQCMTPTKHSKAKTVCIFLGIYCTLHVLKIVYPNIKSGYPMLKVVLTCLNYILLE